METKPLIDAIMRQTTVLLAALSTAAGIRAPLAHIADQIFLELSREIESQGVSRKVVADMFGLALRSYQRRVQRIASSARERNRSLWEGVYQLVCDLESAGRPEIERAFPEDSSEDVGAVLHDLVSSGLLMADRRSVNARYSAPKADDPAGQTDRGPEAIALMVWAAVYRKGAQTPSELASTLGLAAERVEEAVAKLVAKGRIRWNADRSALQADTFVVPLGAEQGWAAAVLHHFGAVASALATKVSLGPNAQANDRVGGATLAFDVRAGHPYEEEIYGLLERVRTDVNALWSKVAAHNKAHPIPDADKFKVTFYFGQTVDQVEEPGETAADGPGAGPSNAATAEKCDV